MRVPNGFFGNGPGNGDDTQNQRDLEAYNRNRLQMTVATSTFAGIALVGMFCSCLWFACCRNSSSKTRKKGRTWASAANEAGLHNANPYTYDGSYLDSQGYMQMGNGMDDGCIAGDGVAPYISNPLYHPNALYSSDVAGLSGSYDLGDHFGLGLGGKSQLLSSLGGSDGVNPKDVPPSYTALFFASTDSYNGVDGKKPTSASGNRKDASSSSKVTSDVRVTNIQPIHLKVTSNAQQSQDKKENVGKVSDINEFDRDSDDEMDFYAEGPLKKEDSIPPVSLVSVESDQGKDGEKDDNLTPKILSLNANRSDKTIPEEDDEGKERKSGNGSQIGFKGYRRL